MVKIENFDQILVSIETIKAKKQGYLTNFYHDRNKVSLWIKHSMLFYINVEETLFVIKENTDFLTLFYFTTTTEQLQKALSLLKFELTGKTLVVDIIGNDSSLRKLEFAFAENSFQTYSSLCRMSRVISGKEIEILSKVNFAIREDALTIELLLKEYFDPVCEQLPLLEEIIDWIDLKHLLVCKVEDQIIGFLIFDLKGKTSYLRYWFTNPLHRDKKIGSQLLRKFFLISNSTKRQLFWVIEDNENAIKRYRHYGFERENMYDKVLISKL
jgi:GNAT superfamily N-acetyltransferase